MKNPGTKPIAAGAGLVAGLTLLFLKYCSGWLFTWVDPVDIPVAPTLQLAAASSSQSPARTTAADGSPTWSVAVVTNRPQLRPTEPMSLVSLSTPQESGETDATADPARAPGLAEQARSALYYVPESTYGFCDVQFLNGRCRGECSLVTEDETGSSGTTQLAPLLRTGASDFYDRISDLVESAEAKEVLVFVHGFNVTLEEATARAAQICEDMPFHGVVIAFSWPSLAETSAYLADEVVAERYFWNLGQLLARLHSVLPDETGLSVLAHSMGNRVTLRAICTLTGSMGPTGTRPFMERAELRTRFPEFSSWAESRIQTPPLSNLIMAAPDVGREEFISFLSDIRHTASRLVLYSSDRDVALEGSRRIHGDYRAGDSRARIQIDGLQVIHVTGYSMLDPTGHSYYGSNDAVLTQLSRMLLPQVRLDLSRPLSELPTVGGPAETDSPVRTVSGSNMPQPRL